MYTLDPISLSSDGRWRYIEDLMRVGLQVDTSKSVMRLTPVSTPLKLVAWEQHLCNHPDQDLLLTS